jgi:hypothetical protein
MGKYAEMSNVEFPQPNLKAEFDARAQRCRAGYEGAAIIKFQIPSSKFQRSSKTKSQGKSKI